MPQPALFTLALALGVASALALVSCGGGEDAKLLPGTTAQEIAANLDAVEQLASEGECAGAAGAAEEVSAEIEALTGVDPKLQQALERGAARLGEVVATCEEPTTDAVAPLEEAPTTERTEPPGQEKKAEREREEEEAEEPADEEAKKPTPPSTPPTTPEAPPSEEGGGTGAPGGLSPAAPAPEGE